MISVAQAHACRRALLATAALGATLAAHVAGSGGLHLTWSAPVLWAWVIGTAALLGTRTRPWASRSLPRTLGLLLGLQAMATSQ